MTIKFTSYKVSPFSKKSVGHRIFEIHFAFLSTESDQIMTTESWMTDANDIFIPDKFVPAMFTFFSRSGINCNGGGISLIFKQSLGLAVLQSSCKTAFEIIVCFLYLLNLHFVINCWSTIGVLKNLLKQ